MWDAWENSEESLARAWVALERSRVEVQRGAVEMAFAIAERVLEERAAHDPTIAARALRDAVAAVGEEGELRVMVHPLDLEACREVIVSLGNRLTWIEDARVGRGGVVLASLGGCVDARLRVRLARLRAVLEGPR